MGQWNYPIIWMKYKILWPSAYSLARKTRIEDRSFTASYKQRFDGLTLKISSGLEKYHITWPTRSDVLKKIGLCSVPYIVGLFINKRRRLSLTSSFDSSAQIWSLSWFDSLNWKQLTFSQGSAYGNYGKWTVSISFLFFRESRPPKKAGHKVLHIKIIIIWELHLREASTHFKISN